MKTLGIILFVSAALTAHPEVVIYKIVQTNVWTGGGAKVRQVVSGRIVVHFDFEAQTIGAGVFTWLPGTRFQVDCPNASAVNVKAPLGVSQAGWFLDGTAFIDTTQVGVVHYYLRGNNASISGLTNKFPKVLTGNYRAAYTAANGNDLLGEGTLVATYLAGATQAANTAQQTWMDFLESLRQTWLGKGWVEVTPDAPCM